MRCIVALIGLILLGGCATATDTRWKPLPVATEVDSTTVTYYWDTPTTGTPVEYYLLESSSGQEWTASRAKRRITVPADTPHRVRVRGVDADSITGTWSVWSDEWPTRADDLPDRREEWQR